MKFEQNPSEKKSEMIKKVCSSSGKIIFWSVVFNLIQSWSKLNQLMFALGLLLYFFTIFLPVPKKLLIVFIKHFLIYICPQFIHIQKSVSLLFIVHYFIFNILLTWIKMWCKLYLLFSEFLHVYGNFKFSS